MYNPYSMNKEAAYEEALLTDLLQKEAEYEEAVYNFEMYKQALQGPIPRPVPVPKPVPRPVPKPVPKPTFPNIIGGSKKAAYDLEMYKRAIADMGAPSKLTPPPVNNTSGAGGASGLRDFSNIRPPADLRRNNNNVIGKTGPGRNTLTRLNTPVAPARR